MLSTQTKSVPPGDVATPSMLGRYSCQSGMERCCRLACSLDLIALDQRRSFQPWGGANAPSTPPPNECFPGQTYPRDDVSTRSERCWAACPLLFFWIPGSLEIRPTCDPSLNSAYQRSPATISLSTRSPQDNDAGAQVTAFRAKNHDVSTF